MHAASPAGAVQAYRLINKIAEAKFPRAAKIAKLIQKTQDPAKKAALTNLLYRTMQEEDSQQ
jgi:hypothetical protein